MQVVREKPKARVEYTYTAFEKLKQDTKGYIKELPIDGIIWGDTFEILKHVASNSIDFIAFSPPFWGLRKYKGKDIQFGLEASFLDYIAKFKVLMAEIFRVLKPTGSVFVNIGDTYNGAKSGNTSGRKDQKSTIGNEKAGINEMGIKKKLQKQLPKGSLMNIPARIALMCTDEIGFCQPNWIHWIANNKKPNSSKRRWSVNTEAILWFVKDQSKYYFDTQYEEISESMLKEIMQKYTGKAKKDYASAGAEDASDLKRKIIESYASGKKVGRIARAILDVNVHGYHGMHVAVWPIELVEHLVRAACPRYICNKCGACATLKYEEKRINTRPGTKFLKGGGKSGTHNDPDAKFHKSDLSKYRQKIIRTPIGYELPCKHKDSGTHAGVGLDPFMGSGSAAIALKLNGCNFLGFETVEAYCKEAVKRIAEELPKIEAERAKEAAKKQKALSQMTLEESIQLALE